MDPNAGANWCSIRRRGSPVVLGSHLREPQPSNCFLVQMPLDILLIIANFLPLHAELIFTHTCVTVKKALTRPSNANRRLNWDEHLEYLTAVISNRTDRWVCDDCDRTHPTYVEDTPRTPLTPDCYRPKFFQVRNPWNEGFKLPCHRHVQLALKYIRLGPQSAEEQAHLDDLLRPVHLTQTIDCALIQPYVYSGSVRLEQCHCPKVVHGRYFILHTCTYTLLEDYRGPPPILEACKHRRVEFHSREKELSVENIEGFFLNLNMRSPLAERVWRADKVGWSCPDCATDLEAYWNGSSVTMKVWRDLGAEGSPFATDWRRQIGDHSPGSSRIPTERQWGSVRGSYERGEQSEEATQGLL
ncbi:hypothetical protein CEP52_007317 [Fusarium oligoseptatum]|uniref:F-box domain-containing protein n=1 Tax=Fusarium oligoseptatum TaxID=2604345 RepID=A0A428TNG4_9HYPO|nr:hypothetical protein CEP52_007317 [Fusarium oligoseptatum]